ncbi:hypothetical protein ACLHZR_04270, partial [Escherichia coli]
RYVESGAAKIVSRRARFTHNALVRTASSVMISAYFLFCRILLVTGYLILSTTLTVRIMYLMLNVVVWWVCS